MLWLFSGKSIAVKNSILFHSFIIFDYFSFSTFVCPTEIIAFSDRIDEFSALKCAVVAASTDSKFSHFAWISQPRREGGLGDMRIPVMADPTQQISRDYGVLKEDEGVAYRLLVTFTICFVINIIS